MRKNYANYTQNLHLTLYPSDFPRVTKCIVYALNYTQTIHKLYIETFQTRHKNYTREPTAQLYILFFEHESNRWSEWIVRDESDVCDGRNERTGVTKGRAKRKDGRNERTGWWRCQRDVTEVSREQNFINIYILQKQSVRGRRSVVPTSRLVTPTNRSVTFPLKPGALLVFLRCAPSFS